MTSTVYWSFPTRVVFGAGSVAQVGREAKRLQGTRALLVADAGVVSARLHEPVIRSLEDSGVVTSIFSEVDPNPVESNVHAGVAAYRSKHADLIVALGGGSPLDVAKLIRLKAFPGVHELPLVEYDDATGGDRHITASVPPMIAIPTTAGTGSEVGRSGVVQLDINHRKTVIFSPHLMANVAVLDPELTRSLPAKITAATGFDALTHCLEAYLSKGDHPMADAIALGGLRLVAASLLRVVQAPDDIEARGDMMKAAMMGAVAFQKGLGACHSLAHPLSSECGLHHGLANAVCLPAVVEFNAGTVPSRVAEAAAALGAAGADLAGALRKLRAALGLPSGLRETGVRDDQLELLATKAFADACHTSNPRACTRDDLLALYRSSMLRGNTPRRGVLTAAARASGKSGPGPCGRGELPDGAAYH
jgi:4-hydroxybutyrate dehydrogenase